MCIFRNGNTVLQICNEVVFYVVCQYRSFHSVTSNPVSVAVPPNNWSCNIV